MKDRPAYLPLYVRDFLTDPNVLAMTWTQKAVYLRMLMLSWEAGPLSANDAMVARMIDQESLESDVAAVREAAWEVDADGNWFNARLEHERQRWHTLHEKRSMLGQEGNRRRWNAGRSPTDRGAIAERSPSDRNTQAQAQAQEQTEKKREEDSPADAGSPPPPASPAAASPARKRERRKPIEWTGEVPEALRTPAFLAEWEGWLRYRRSEHKAREVVTQSAGDLQLEEFAAWGAERAVRAIKHTRKNQWQGIREAAPERNPGGFGAGSFPPPNDDLRRIL